MSARCRRRKRTDKHRVVFFCVLLLIFAGIGLLWSESCRFSRIVISMQELDGHINRAAAKYGLDPELVKALIWRESRFDPNAVGKSGEVGLMQLVPAGSPGAVAEWSRITGAPPPSRRRLFEVETNLDIGCWYLADAMHQFSNYRCGTELALAAYNAGMSRAKRWKPETADGEVLDRIDIASTRNYVKFIMQRYCRNQRKK